MTDRKRSIGFFVLGAVLWVAAIGLDQIESAPELASSPSQDLQTGSFAQAVLLDSADDPVDIIFRGTDNAEWLRIGAKDCSVRGKPVPCDDGQALLDGLRRMINAECPRAQ